MSRDSGCPIPPEAPRTATLYAEARATPGLWLLLWFDLRLGLGCVSEEREAWPAKKEAWLEEGDL